jgi:hypothetical protein
MADLFPEISPPYLSDKRLEGSLRLSLMMTEPAPNIETQ